MTAIIDGEGYIWIKVGHDEYVTLSSARSLEISKRQQIVDEYGQVCATTLPWDPRQVPYVMAPNQWATPA